MWFSKKYKVPSIIHSEQVIKKMCNESPAQLDYWKYVHDTYGITREYSYKDTMNYFVFDSREDYLLFLLKL